MKSDHKAHVPNITHSILADVYECMHDGEKHWHAIIQVGFRASGTASIQTPKHSTSAAAWHELQTTLKALVNDSKALTTCDNAKEFFKAMIQRRNATHH